MNDLRIPFDVEEFRAAIEARDTERISNWIEVAPLEARAELQRRGDYAKAHAGEREVTIQQARAASFAGSISRADFEQILADHKAWKRSNEGFVRIIGRFIQQAQAVHAQQKLARHEAGQELDNGRRDRLHDRIDALEDRVAELEALVARLLEGAVR